MTPFQAYAELEEDTPGQILGVTHKTDGKSSSFSKGPSSSSKTSSSSHKMHTQGEPDPEPVSEETYQADQKSTKRLFAYGVALGAFLVAWFLTKSERDNEMRLVEEQQRQRAGGGGGSQNTTIFKDA